ncbi:hypothetical protein TRFO_35217 [Tritrichomonas foetus]|uniref:Uncharacterized protein n=1 Tax=Tritrichomonas foetus TaxID=1144522 RepID=A0A1J4JI85_9EUKA|nr:hypothetical protein TRFO_35217 [Tritrichomonas foetus]|eukprot:OHS98401.1 hypothetical protein TRFO_35217 [Tritrichomonas foetus]
MSKKSKLPSLFGPRIDAIRLKKMHASQLKSFVDDLSHEQTEYRNQMHLLLVNTKSVNEANLKLEEAIKNRKMQMRKLIKKLARFSEKLEDAEKNQKNEIKHLKHAKKRQENIKKYSNPENFEKKVSQLQDEIETLNNDCEKFYQQKLSDEKYISRIVNMKILYEKLLEINKNFSDKAKKLIQNEGNMKSQSKRNNTILNEKQKREQKYQILLLEKRMERNNQIKDYLNVLNEKNNQNLEYEIEKEGFKIHKRIIEANKNLEVIDNAVNIGKKPVDELDSSCSETSAMSSVSTFSRKDHSLLNQSDFKFPDLPNQQKTPMNRPRKRNQTFMTPSIPPINLENHSPRRKITVMPALSPRKPEDEDDNDLNEIARSLLNSSETNQGAENELINYSINEENKLNEEKKLNEENNNINQNNNQDINQDFYQNMNRGNNQNNNTHNHGDDLDFLEINDFSDDIPDVGIFIDIEEQYRNIFEEKDILIDILPQNFAYQEKFPLVDLFSIRVPKHRKPLPVNKRRKRILYQEFLEDGDFVKLLRNNPDYSILQEDGAKIKRTKQYQYFKHRKKRCFRDPVYEFYYENGNIVKRPINFILKNVGKRLKRIQKPIFEYFLNNDKDITKKRVKFIDEQIEDEQGNVIKVKNPDYSNRIEYKINKNEDGSIEIVKSLIDYKEEEIESEGGTTRKVNVKNEKPEFYYKEMPTNQTNNNEITDNHTTNEIMLEKKLIEYETVEIDGQNVLVPKLPETENVFVEDRLGQIIEKSQIIETIEIESEGGSKYLVQKEIDPIENEYYESEDEFGDMNIKKRLVNFVKDGEFFKRIENKNKKPGFYENEKGEFVEFCAENTEICDIESENGTIRKTIKENKPICKMEIQTQNGLIEQDVEFEKEKIDEKIFWIRKPVDDLFFIEKENESGEKIIECKRIDLVKNGNKFLDPNVKEHYEETEYESESGTKRKVLKLKNSKAENENEIPFELDEKYKLLLVNLPNGEKQKIYVEKAEEGEEEEKNFSDSKQIDNFYYFEEIDEKGNEKIIKIPKQYQIVSKTIDGKNFLFREEVTPFNSTVYLENSDGEIIKEKIDYEVVEKINDDGETIKVWKKKKKQDGLRNDEYYTYYEIIRNDGQKEIIPKKCVYEVKKQKMHDESFHNVYVKKKEEDFDYEYFELDNGEIVKIKVYENEIPMVCSDLVTRKVKRAKIPEIFRFIKTENGDLEKRTIEFTPPIETLTELDDVIMVHKPIDPFEYENIEFILENGEIQSMKIKVKYVKTFDGPHQIIWEKVKPPYRSIEMVLEDGTTKLITIDPDENAEFREIITKDGIKRIIKSTYGTNDFDTFEYEYEYDKNINDNGEKVVSKKKYISAKNNNSSDLNSNNNLDEYEYEYENIINENNIIQVKRMKMNKLSNSGSSKVSKSKGNKDDSSIYAFDEYEYSSEYVSDEHDEKAKMNNKRRIKYADEISEGDTFRKIKNIIELAEGDIDSFDRQSNQNNSQTKNNFKNHYEWAEIDTEGISSIVSENENVSRRSCRSRRSENNDENFDGSHLYHNNNDINSFIEPRKSLSRRSIRYNSMKDKHENLNNEIEDESEYEYEIDDENSHKTLSKEQIHFKLEEEISNGCNTHFVKQQKEKETNSDIDKFDERENDYLYTLDISENGLKKIKRIPKKYQFIDEYKEEFGKAIKVKKPFYDEEFDYEYDEFINEDGSKVRINKTKIKYENTTLESEDGKKFLVHQPILGNNYEFVETDNGDIIQKKKNIIACKEGNSLINRNGKPLNKSQNKVCFNDEKENEIEDEYEYDENDNKIPIEFEYYTDEQNRKVKRKKMNHRTEYYEIEDGIIEKIDLIQCHKKVLNGEGKIKTLCYYPNPYQIEYYCDEDTPKDIKQTTLTFEQYETCLNSYVSIIINKRKPQNYDFEYVEIPISDKEVDKDNPNNKSDSRLVIVKRLKRFHIIRENEKITRCFLNPVDFEFDEKGNQIKVEYEKKEIEINGENVIVNIRKPEFEYVQLNRLILYRPIQYDYKIDDDLKIIRIPKEEFDIVEEFDKEKCSTKMKSIPRPFEFVKMKNNENGDEIIVKKYQNFVYIQKVDPETEKLINVRVSRSHAGKSEVSQEQNYLWNNASTENSVISENDFHNSYLEKEKRKNRKKTKKLVNKWPVDDNGNIQRPVKRKRSQLSRSSSIEQFLPSAAKKLLESESSYSVSPEMSRCISARRNVIHHSRSNQGSSDNSSGHDLNTGNQNKNCKGKESVEVYDDLYDGDYSCDSYDDPDDIFDLDEDGVYRKPIDNRAFSKKIVQDILQRKMEHVRLELEYKDSLFLLESLRNDNQDLSDEIDFLLFTIKHSIPPSKIENVIQIYIKEVSPKINDYYVTTTMTDIKNEDINKQINEQNKFMNVPAMIEEEKEKLIVFNRRLEVQNEKMDRFQNLFEFYDLEMKDKNQEYQELLKIDASEPIRRLRQKYQRLRGTIQNLNDKMDQNINEEKDKIKEIKVLKCKLEDQKNLHDMLKKKILEMKKNKRPNVQTLIKTMEICKKSESMHRGKMKMIKMEEEAIEDYIRQLKEEIKAELSPDNEEYIQQMKEQIGNLKMIYKSTAEPNTTHRILSCPEEIFLMDQEIKQINQEMKKLEKSEVTLNDRIENIVRTLSSKRIKIPMKWAF